jgi:hypothetical protein
MTVSPVLIDLALYASDWESAGEWMVALGLE